ncbi:hypothetical protein BJY18_000114 [Amycolatopsis jiangsuensis]|uniref:Uncharacterized protein n=1 Tax=Amycolatopsis jiangsuensis TaxID=1181879 RepID=A0A840IM25_9PSEU|nr:hypothetical protein [Amycolatopsis jiangsuensis]
MSSTVRFLVGDATPDDDGSALPWWLAGVGIAVLRPRAG